MIKEKIITGKAYLGIELGSTRIKACLIDETATPIASGSYEWDITKILSKIKIAGEKGAYLCVNIST